MLAGFFVKPENKIHRHYSSARLEVFSGLRLLTDLFANLLRVPKYQIVKTCDYVLQVLETVLVAPNYWLLKLYLVVCHINVIFITEIIFS